MGGSERLGPGPSAARGGRLRPGAQNTCCHGRRRNSRVAPATRASTVTRRKLSVVCPVFNEQDTVPLFFERFSAAMAPLADTIEWELIFTNNRSTDATADRVLALRQADPRVQLLTMSRNVGYQYSVMAGLKQSSGHAIVVIDVDCEDPPELIPTFVQKWRDGNDVVYGIRDKRPEPAWVTGARKLFYRLNRTLADSDIILDMAEFGLMTAEVRDAVVCSDSTFPFVRGEVAHWGFSRVGVRYDRQERVAGQTHYNLWGMTTFAVASILSSTTFPLRFTLYSLPVVVGLSAGVVLAHWLSGWAGWLSFLLLLQFTWLSSAVAGLALYLARTYKNGIKRPGAVIDWARSAVNAPREASPNALPRLWSEQRGDGP